MKLQLLFLNAFILCCSMAAQTITIPDSNFEQALVDLGFDSNGLNGNILEIDALAIDTLKISNPIDNELLPNVEFTIANLQGIEAMKNLVYLDVSYNDIYSLDVSNNTKLTLLSYYSETSEEGIPGFGYISNIDVSNNLALEELYLRGNKLNFIDLSNNTELLKFSISDNNLINLDVSANTKLTRLVVYNNEFS